MRILTVVGARPQFIKASVVSRAFNARSEIREILVHTGQHFDTNMSQVFFDELGIPAPKYHLGIGGGTHGQNTGRMLEAVEKVILDEGPAVVLVYGDTDSTLAGALAAAKVHVPVVHIEAGLRSFNMNMPEEINRRLTDHVSDLLLTPNEKAIQNLRSEGIAGERVHNIGDVMYDAAIYYGEHASKVSRVLESLGLVPKSYILATIHRQENTDNLDRLSRILTAFANAFQPVVLPLHPRTRNKLKESGIAVPKNVVAIEPVGYTDMVMLEQQASLIATDSGGVQKEAYFHKVPCLTFRDETEWNELVELGWNRLMSPDSEDLCESLSQPYPMGSINHSPYGDGKAAELAASLILRYYS